MARCGCSQHLRAGLSDAEAQVIQPCHTQGYLAGIGNIYADEILFHCGLHPEKPANRLGEDKLKELFQTLGTVLRRAIEFRADPERFPDSYLLPQRHKGGKCPHGHGELQKTSLSGRASYYCPVCQVRTF